MPPSARLRGALALAFLGLPLITAAARGAEPAPPRRVAVRAGRLLDGSGGPPRTNVVVLIEGDRIQQVGAGLAIAAGAEVVDLSRATVLPGLIDCHTHLTSQSNDY